MTDPAVPEAEEELVDYEEEEAGADDKKAVAAAAGASAGGGAAAAGKGAGYVGIHSSGFKDFLLKPELLRAIVDCGFEHPSEGEEKEGKADDDDVDDDDASSTALLLFFFFLPARFHATPFGARFRIDTSLLEVPRPCYGVNTTSSTLSACGKASAGGGSSAIVAPSNDV